MIELLKAIAVLVAAILIGNWYITEAKNKRAEGKPWYSAYLSLPGMVIIVAIVIIPLIIWLINR